MAKEKVDQDMAAACFEKIQLSKELYRLGHTKAKDIAYSQDAIARNIDNTLRHVDN